MSEYLEGYTLRRARTQVVISTEPQTSLNVTYSHGHVIARIYMYWYWYMFEYTGRTVCCMHALVSAHCIHVHTPDRQNHHKPKLHTHSHGHVIAHTCTGTRRQTVGERFVTSMHSHRYTIIMHPRLLFVTLWSAMESPITQYKIILRQLFILSAAGCSVIQVLWEA